MSLVLNRRQITLVDQIHTGVPVGDSFIQRVLVVISLCAGDSLDKIGALFSSPIEELVVAVFE